MESLVRKLSIFLAAIAGVVLAFMLVFTLTDVVSRAIGRPILGGFEVISFSGAVAIGFALPYTTLMKGHVLVDFVLEMLSARNKVRMEIATRIMSILLFLWIGWNFYVYGMDLIRTGEVTQMFKMPFYPISFGLAFSCLVQCLALVSQVMKLKGAVR